MANREHRGIRGTGKRELARKHNRAHGPPGEERAFRQDPAAPAGPADRAVSRFPKRSGVGAPYLVQLEPRDLAGAPSFAKAKGGGSTMHLPKCSAPLRAPSSTLSEPGAASFAKAKGGGSTMHLPKCSVPFGVLVLALITSAFLMARSIGGSGPAWLGWLALVPLFAAIRVLRPVHAALCGALCGACLFIFCLSTGVWHGEASALPRADGLGTVHVASPLVGGEDAPGTSPDATSLRGSRTSGDPTPSSRSLPLTFRVGRSPEIGSHSELRHVKGRFVAPLLLLLLPALYAFFGAWLTRRIGFSPFVLGVAWMFVEFSFEPLGLRHGLLSSTQPADGALMHYLGSAFGYVLIAFLVAFVNATLVAGLGAACRAISSQQYLSTPAEASTVLCPQTFTCFPLYAAPIASPRAPPSANKQAF